MPECVFCKIVSREIDSKRVYEDENNLAFLDIKPANKGHVLVIPKYHASAIYDMPDENLKSLITAVKKVSVAVKESTKPQGINIIQNNERASGQIVDHIHFHVIPRNFNDGNEIKFANLEITEEEQKKIAKQIRESIKPMQAKKDDKVDVMLNNIDKSLKELDDVLK